MPHNLDLALIGNGAVGLLVDSTGSVVWGCFLRFDGDATFCATRGSPSSVSPKAKRTWDTAV